VPEKSHPRIWLAPSSGGAASRTAADNVDLIPGGLRWAADGRALYFETGVRGASQLYRVDLAARRAAAVTSGERTVHLVDVHENTGRLVYGVNDPTHLDDLYIADLSGRNEKALTHLNAALYRQLQLVPVERVPFKGADGWDVDGFFMKPVGWEPGKQYPMILTIHGGPAGMFGFDWYHEFQVYAAHGWAVFFTNPRGSTGYGEKFERGIELNWGGKDYVDVMNSVDAALAKYPWIDRDRLGVTGGSYGGFMTNCQLAGVLVRALHRWQCQGGAARRTVADGRDLDA
jgi:dipeptidyl aminopeptidase/acylaminoacyl peptidase